MRPAVSETLLETFEHSDEWWKSTAMQAVEDLAATGRPFEAYDVTELGVVDPPCSSHWGSLFHRAHSRGLIEIAGYGQSRRPSRAHGLTRLWVGTQKSDAGSPAKKNADVATGTTNR